MNYIKLKKDYKYYYDEKFFKYPYVAKFYTNNFKLSI